jgi:hypothetical protein
VLATLASLSLVADCTEELWEESYPLFCSFIEQLSNGYSYEVFRVFYGEYQL